MAFDLRIRFIGLCLFVPDRSHHPTHIDVLLPQWDNHHGGQTNGAKDGGAGTAHHHHDPHIAAVVWNKAFEEPHSAELASSCNEHQMTGTQLDLNLLTAAPLHSPPTEIVNLGGADGLRIARAHLGRQPIQPPVLARVALPAGTGTPGPSTMWQFGSGLKPFTWWMDWQIPGVTSDTLSLVFTGPDGTVVQRSLYPLQHTGTLDLTIYNVPLSELNGQPIPRPASGSTAHHLMAHFVLGTHVSTNLPTYVSGEAAMITPCIGAPEPGPRDGVSGRGGVVPIPAGMNPYSCLLSEALPEDDDPAPDPEPDPDPDPDEPGDDPPPHDH